MRHLERPRQEHCHAGAGCGIAGAESGRAGSAPLGRRVAAPGTRVCQALDETVLRVGRAYVSESWDWVVPRTLAAGAAQQHGQHRQGAPAAFPWFPLGSRLGAGLLRCHRCAGLEGFFPAGSERAVGATAPRLPSGQSLQSSAKYARKRCSLPPGAVSQKVRYTPRSPHPPPTKPTCTFERSSFAPVL